MRYSVSMNVNACARQPPPTPRPTCAPRSSGASARHRQLSTGPRGLGTLTATVFSTGDAAGRAKCFAASRNIAEH